MEKTKEFIESDCDAIEPAALAAQYLRLFAHYLPAFGDFDQFMAGLEHMVEEDTYLLGFAKLGGNLQKETKLPDFENLSGDETVLSVCEENGNQGFIQYSAKDNGRAFGAGDMHLMGAIAGFISLLSSKAREFHDQGRAFKVLQYLINQLPLGVVCCGDDGRLIAQSNLASRQLGESGGSSLSAIATDTSRFKKGREQFHFEVNGRLLYSEGRRLAIEERFTVTAFVLYDLSNYRQRLTGDLEREAFRSESRGAPFTLAILQARPNATPGKLNQLLKRSVESLEIPKSAIHPLDAFRCACLFPGKALRPVRQRLKEILEEDDEIARLSLAQHVSGEGDEAPGTHLLERAKQLLEPLGYALLPRVLVLDPYPSVGEALMVATSEACQAKLVHSAEEAVQQIISGAYDGLFVGLDECEPEALSQIQCAARAVSEGLKVFYLSYKQPSLAREQAGLDEDAIIFQKPFQAGEIVENLNLQFN